MQRRPSHESTDRPFTGSRPGSATAAESADTTDEAAPVSEPARRPRPDSLRGSAIAAAIALAIGVVLAGTALLDTFVFATAVLLTQLALIAVWGLVTRPPGMAGAMAVGALSAVAAQAVALTTDSTGVGGLVAVLAGAFGATTLAQLTRGVARRNVTESFGTTLTGAVAVVALAVSVVSQRTDDAALVAVVASAAGGAVLCARSVDLVWPRPAVHSEVPRGVTGLVVGSAFGAAVAAVWVLAGADLSLGPTALVGWLVGTAATLADLAVEYAQAGRVAAGGGPRRQIAGAALGPLVALAVTAPVGYLLGVTL